MGFFKKFFSIGTSKKSKKRAAIQPIQPSNDDGAEAEVCRLLRSSSARYAESQVGVVSLPPLPHPIDSVIPRPKSSSATIASVSARSTYSVIIRSRTIHSRTEFPNAYPPMDVTVTPKRSLTDAGRRRSKSLPITPRDKNRLLLLRQDPSVASLLNHYDDDGHLNSTLFSNTPPPKKEGCVQTRRTGSTLQHSSLKLKTRTEDDISWTEKFPGETDCNSSTSSIGPQTPADTCFPHTRSVDDKSVLSIECDTSATDHPTFSSLEVELSVSTDHAHSQTLYSPNGNSMTPQRASQIFGFLGDKKRAHDGPISRLPQLKTTTPTYRRFSAESSISDTKHSQIPLPLRSNTYSFQLASPTSSSLASDTTRSPPSSPTTAAFLSLQLKDGVSIQHAVVSQHTGQSSCGPRGPRTPFKIPSRQSTGPLSAPCDVGVSESAQSIFGQKSITEEKYITAGVSRSREMRSQIPKLRCASDPSSSSAESKHKSGIDSPCRHPVSLQPAVRKKSSLTDLTGITLDGKENDMPSRLPQPVTPIRPFGLHLHDPPSPASSSELSPVAKQMMANLRQQRMRARRRERQSGRLGSSQSRIRY